MGDYYLSKIHLAMINIPAQSTENAVELIPTTDYASELNSYLLIVRATC